MKSRQGFSYFSGVVFGLLCFLVAYVLFGGFSQWALFNCLLFSSMAGGAYGAHVNRKRLPPLVMGRGKTLWREIIFSYFLIVLLIFLFWFLVFGNTVWVRLNKNASVHSMAQKVTPVSGKGVFLSGIFKLGNQDEILSFDESSDTETVSLTITKNEYSRIKGKAKEALYRDFINRFHRFNQSLKITQNDGVLTVKDYTGAEWRGTVDVQGAFKVNGKIVKGDVVTNLKFEGSFHDRDHINYYLSYWEQEGKSGREATCVGTGERLK